MPKNGVYRTNHKTIIKDESNQEKVYNYLLNKKDGATQTKISKELGITQPSVSKIIKKLQENIENYGNSKHILILENGVYKIVRYKDLSIGLRDFATEKQKEEFNDCFSIISYEFKDLNMLTGASAEELSTNAVLYKIDIKHVQKVKSSLERLYGKNIYDFILHDDLLYIVLAKDCKYLKEIRISLFDLYKKSVKKKNL